MRIFLQEFAEKKSKLTEELLIPGGCRAGTAAVSYISPGYPNVNNTIVIRYAPTCLLHRLGAERVIRREVI